MTSAVAVRRSAYAALALVYLLLFPYHPGLRSPNELVRLHQTRAIAEFHTVELNEALQTWGRVGDMSVKDGRYHSSKAPLLSFAAVPLYKVLSALNGGGLDAVGEVPLVFFARLLLTVLPTLWMLWLLRRFLTAQLPEPIADALVITYGLGSLALSYSLLFMSHQSTAVLLFTSFFILWRCARGEWAPSGYIWAGAAAGATVAAEYTGALGVLALATYGVLTVVLRHESWSTRWRRLAICGGYAVLGALPFVLGLMAYHQLAFGHPLHSGYKYLADAAYQPWHLGGFLGIRTPDPRAFVLSFFGPLRGLFTLAPFLLLALPGLFLQPHGTFEERARRAFTWLLLGGYAYFTSSFSYDSWGWTTGPRHLAGLVPFLLLPAGLFLQWLGDRGKAWGVGIGAGLCAASIVVTGAITCVNYVPDDVSSPLFALVLPLWKLGAWPPTALSLLGVPLFWGALPVLLGLLLAAILVVRMLAPSWRAAGLAALTVAALLVLHAAMARHTPQDAGAVRFLASVWLGRPPG